VVVARHEGAALADQEVAVGALVADRNFLPVSPLDVRGCALLGVGELSFFLGQSVMLAAARASR